MTTEKLPLWEDLKSKAYYVKYLPDHVLPPECARKRPAVVICPGGAYMFTSDREGEPVAMEYLCEGYAVFVLHYSTLDMGEVTHPIPLMDIAKMMLTIRQNANEWNIDPDKIAVCGFSAGGHLCAELSVHWRDKYLSDKLQASSDMLKPNAAILCYALLDLTYQMDALKKREDAKIPFPGSDVTPEGLFLQCTHSLMGGCDEERLRKVSSLNYIASHTPPTFIWHTFEDGLIYAGNPLRYALGLYDAGVPCELHIYEKGAHGLSLATLATANNADMINPDAARWMELSKRFLARHFNL